MTTLTRRSLLGGIGALLAAPAIVRAASLMPVKAFAAGAADHGFQFTGFYSLLPNDQFGSIAMDAAGKIWVQSGDKIMCYTHAGEPTEDRNLAKRLLDSDIISAEFFYRV